MPDSIPLSPEPQDMSDMLAILPRPPPPLFLSHGPQPLPPASPNTHRSLRKLHSAHDLGSKASMSPPPVAHHPLTQQHLMQLQSHHQPQHQGFGLRGMSPIRRRHPSPPKRNRATSDASPPAQQDPSSEQLTPAEMRPSLTRRSPRADNMSLQRLFHEGPPDGDLVGALSSMRFRAMDNGIKADPDGMSSVRIYAWLVFLDAPTIETDAYLDLIHRGACPSYSKIRNDTFRTLTTDPLFRRRVSESSLIRVLNAVIWKLRDAREGRQAQHRKRPASSRQSLPMMHDMAAPLLPDSPIRSRVEMADWATQSTTHSPPPSQDGRTRNTSFDADGSHPHNPSDPDSYIQGMNVLAAPFLYAARSEVEAFAAFHTLLTRECPGYIRGAMDGVHRGLSLVDKVLSIVDPKLSFYLTSKNLSAEIYAFPSVLTLCACTPPLPEVLRLWDFLFAYGPHLNILCIVAQLLMIRDQILASPSPIKLLRSFPALQADYIKKIAIGFIHKIPDDVFEEIILHAQ